MTDVDEKTLALAMQLLKNQPQVVVAHANFEFSASNPKFESKAFPTFSYVGEIKNDLPHGRGTATYKAGDQYEGEYVDGKRHGVGRYTFADGGQYKGEYVGGKYHGTGRFTFADGNYYE